jgi:GNAT superfamily N-acetyltransferase
MYTTYQEAEDMSVQYRLLRADEQEAVLDLWVEVFPGTNRAQWEREFVWDQQRFAHTYVAVDANGSLLATMRYLLREVRGLAGERYRTGWLTNVATKPSAQRLGYGRQLLARTLEAMQQEGCAWSLLTADTTAQGFYARYGWRAFPLRYQQGVFTDQEIDRTRRYHIRPYDPESNTQGWEALAAVYDDYNASRPLTTVRDTAYWQGYGQMRLREWLVSANATIFVAEPNEHPEKPVGYVFAHCRRRRKQPARESTLAFVRIVRHFINRHRQRKDQAVIFSRCNLDTIRITQGEPVFRYCRDGRAAALNRILVIQNIAVRDQILPIFEVNRKLVAEWREPCLADHCDRLATTKYVHAVA